MFIIAMLIAENYRKYSNVSDYLGNRRQQCQNTGIKFIHISIFKIIGLRLLYQIVKFCQIYIWQIN